VREKRHSTKSGLTGDSCGGFTLPEILISVVILATGIVTLLECFNVSLSALGTARDVLRSHMLIMDRMADMELSVVGGGKLESEASSGSFGDGNSGYRWDMNVTDISDSSSRTVNSATLDQVDLTVWHDGSPRKYSASTCLRIEKQR
jgi:prepilin-type N-terminal cleavage/methylation domain-containing protein